LVKLSAPFIIPATSANASTGFQISLGSAVKTFSNDSVTVARTVGSVAKIDENSTIFLRIEFLVRFSIKRLLD